MSESVPPVTPRTPTERDCTRGFAAAAGGALTLLAVGLAPSRGLPLFVIDDAMLAAARHPELVNYPLLGLAIVVSLVAARRVRPALEASGDYVGRLGDTARLSAILGIALGLGLGAVAVWTHRYVQLGLTRLAFRTMLYTATLGVVVAVGSALAVAAVLPAALALARRMPLRERTQQRLVGGLVPALLVFVVGGYWLNRLVLPDFLAPTSLAGNAAWALACAGLAWLLGNMGIVLASAAAPRVRRARHPLATVGAVVLAAVVLDAGRLAYALFPVGAGRPNVILVSIDTLRADHVSAYGYRRPTPAIDALAGEGVLFENVIVQAPWTLPSHMSILTSLYPGHHGVTNRYKRLGSAHVMLAEALQNAGYRTGAVTDGGYLSRTFGYKGFEYFDDRGEIKAGRAVEETYVKVLRWLDTHPPRPFFLFVHTYQVHCPYDPPRQHDVYSDPGYRGVVEVAGNCGAYFVRMRPQLQPTDYQYIVDKYDGEVRYTDEVLGRLFTALRERGLWDDTIVVLTSDHGENFADHEAYDIGHAELYDEVVRVPLVVKAPALRAGVRVRDQVESIDIMPTLLDLLGIGLPRTLDGRSVLALARGAERSDGIAFSENQYRDVDAASGEIMQRDYEMVRSAAWKLIRRAARDVELFDLQSDPHERRNVASTQVEIEARLASDLDAQLRATRAAAATSEEDTEVDGALREKLKALGYVQ